MPAVSNARSSWAGVAARLTLYLVDGEVRDIFRSEMTQPRSIDDYKAAVERAV